MKKTKLKMSKNISPTKIKAILLALVIAIVLSAFVIYFIQTIYSSPKYEDCCGKIKPVLLERQENMTQTKCEANGGVWENNYCDYYSECQKQYNDARNKYKLVVFIVAVISGLAAISIGIILALPSVSLGLMLGGTFLTFYGTAVYWSNLTNWLRTLVLGAVLVILIWLGYRKLGR